MIKLVLLRHGESIWNKKNLFTGWTDVDLSEKGKQEALAAGKLLKKEGFTFDIAYTSLLKRAIRTLWSVLDETDLMWIPVFRSWRLNERHYGALQGKNKAETSKEYGEDQVHVWRRSYDTKPPLLSTDDLRYPGLDDKYKDIPVNLIPAGESLRDTESRFLPYWHEIIEPALKIGEKVLISAHGNSLRALVKYLDNISGEEIASLDIPTGIPLVYELDEDVKPIKHYYLGDPEAIKRAAEAVADQGRTKKNK